MKDPDHLVQVEKAIQEKYGEDLFPRHFLISLPVPSYYMGPERLFVSLWFSGVSGSGALLSKLRQNMTLLHPVNEYGKPHHSFCCVGIH